MIIFYSIVSNYQNNNLHHKFTKNFMRSITPPLINVNNSENLFIYLIYIIL